MGSSLARPVRSSCELRDRVHMSRLWALDVLNLLKRAVADAILRFNLFVI